MSVLTSDARLAAPELPLRRLHLMRVGYLLMGVVLARGRGHRGDPVALRVAPVRAGAG
jgi:hypothetical protein